MEHLNKEKLQIIQMRLWRLASGLRGISALFRGDHQESPLTNEEQNGIGDIFNILASELFVLEDILSCGYDSKAITKD